ncbi:hypothetical protein ABIE79_005211 [Bradyrhizobium diazoefficiens]
MAGCASSEAIAADCAACCEFPRSALPPVATPGSTISTASGMFIAVECNELPCSTAAGFAVFTAADAPAAIETGALCSAPLPPLPGLEPASVDSVAAAFAAPDSEACCELPRSALPPVATPGTISTASGMFVAVECNELPCSTAAGSAVFTAADAPAAFETGALCPAPLPTPLPGLEPASVDSVAAAFAAPDSEARCELPWSALAAVATLGWTIAFSPVDESPVSALVGPLVNVRFPTAAAVALWAGSIDDTRTDSPDEPSPVKVLNLVVPPKSVRVGPNWNLKPSSSRMAQAPAVRACSRSPRYWPGQCPYSEQSHRVRSPMSALLRASPR